LDSDVLVLAPCDLTGRLQAVHFDDEIEVMGDVHDGIAAQMGSRIGQVPHLTWNRRLMISESDDPRHENPTSAEAPFAVLRLPELLFGHDILQLVVVHNSSCYQKKLNKSYFSKRHAASVADMNY